MNLKITITSLILTAHALIAQPTYKNPFSVLNSELDELNPVLTPDGKTIYFTIAKDPRNVGGKKDPGDIWYSTIGSDNQWSAPVNAGNTLNNVAFNGVAGFSPDGNEMYLLTHYEPNGQPARTQGIAVSKKRAGQWSRPENISIPYFQNKSNVIAGHVSADNQYFVFSAETYGSYGVEDIFVCEKKSGKWSEPRNLGSKINTQFQEICPSLSSDGRTLYFSTNGRKGKGSFDIFSATRLDDSWTNWSQPENLSSINTGGRDLYFREFSLLGFSVYTSTENSDGYGDIKIFVPEKPYPIDSTALATKTEVGSSVVIEEKKNDPTGNHAVTIYGKVFNAKTNEPISARVTLEPVSPAGESAETLLVSKDGYSHPISSLNQYRVKIEAEGYISSQERLDIQTFEMNDLELNFNLQPIAVGTTVNLKDVLFEQSRTTLLPASFPELDLVVSFLKANPSVRIELSGHTDNRGIPAQNVKLSQGRVDKVREYLISKGIDKKRITGKGYGGNKPIANNDTEETRKLNRRVEFTIRKN